MRAYVLVDIEVTDPVRYSRYVEAVPPTISAHGGRYLARGGRTITLEGDWRPPRCAVLEFESLERATYLITDRAPESTLAEILAGLPIEVRVSEDAGA